MKVPELKALAKERELKRYSKLRKAELIALLTAPRTRPPPPPPPPPSKPDRPDRPTQRKLLEERPLTTRQIKRRRNKINKSPLGI